MVLAFLAALAAVQEPPADVVIRGATLYDGTGAAGVVGDLAFRGDTILAVGEWKGEAGRVIDGEGLAVAPGFIDLHTHSDHVIRAQNLRDNYNYTAQGCTTIVTGNCGGGELYPRDLYVAVDANGAGTNVLHLIPHGQVRARIMRLADRAPSPQELEAMERLVEDGMRVGAWGMSTGLTYAPGTFAKTDELVALAKVVHRYGGIYASHIRNEAGGVTEAVDEAIAIGRASGCPVHISHLKCSSKQAWGKMDRVLGRIETARAAGQKVTADQYPYTASSTGLVSYTVPRWALAGGAAALRTRLADKAQAARIREGILQSFEERTGPDRLRIARYSKTDAYNGKTVAEIAREEGIEPVDVVLKILRGGGAQAVGSTMLEEDMFRAMKKDYVATASDGGAKMPSATRPHPRSYGTFARKIGRYAAGEKRLTLTAAIRSATGLPASILGLKDRGVLRAGAKADVVVFDPDAYRDRATYEDPHQYAVGVRWVFVNGVAVIASGKKTDALPGRALRHARP